MKSLPIRKTALLLSATLFLFCSCKKEVVVAPTSARDATIVEDPEPGWHLYKDTATITYRSIFLSNTRDRLPLPRFAWYISSGTGSSNIMPESNIASNQFLSFESEGTSAVSAPVTNYFYDLPVGDKSVLIPDNVSCVIYDDDRNSLWLHLLGASFTKAALTRSSFQGTCSVVGGTGKFAGAHGELSVRGYFNLKGASDGAIGHSGSIWY